MVTKEYEKEWYDDAKLITNLLIGLLILIVILSQSFAIRQQLGMEYILRSILNHNLIYLIFLTYYICLKTKFGKRKFNYLNVVMSCFGVLMIFGSFLSLFSSFGLDNIFTFFFQFTFYIYFSYSFLGDTSVWTKLRLSKIPFSKIKNIEYFYIVSAGAVMILVVSLIGSFTFDGVVLSLLEAIFMVGSTRYIYLYQKHQEEKLMSLKEAEKTCVDSFSMVEESQPLEASKATSKKKTKTKKEA